MKINLQFTEKYASLFRCGIVLAEYTLIRTTHIIVTDKFYLCGDGLVFSNIDVVSFKAEVL